MPLPNFFILGAAKAGTTSLYKYLKQHPNIYFPKNKEPHFFDDHSSHHRGVAWYAQEFFSGSNKFTARGEATPTLHKAHIVAPRIKEVYGERASELRFIVILRDPVRRAWSHYLHQQRNCAEQEPFEIALKQEESRLLDNPNNWVGYFRDGLYAQYLEIWLQLFNKKQFLFLLHEDLKTNPNQTIKKILAFLDVDTSIAINTNFRTNVASKPKSITLMKALQNPPPYITYPFKVLLSQSNRRRLQYYLRRINLKPYKTSPELDSRVASCLREKYTPSILELENIIDRDLYIWLYNTE